eukprot:EG_transcript_20260
MDDTSTPPLLLQFLSVGAEQHTGATAGNASSRWAALLAACAVVVALVVIQPCGQLHRQHHLLGLRRLVGRYVKPDGPHARPSPACTVALWRRRSTAPLGAGSEPPAEPRATAHAIAAILADLARRPPLPVAGTPLCYCPVDENATPLGGRIAALPGGGHAMRVLKAALYVGAGELDAAHNLVTPLSWGAPTPFAGPPIPNSPARQDASYVHALIHRAEGGVEGEEGVGFSNSCYWWMVTGPHPVMPEVLRAAHAAAQTPSAREVVGRMGPAWSPTLFVRACQDAVRRRDAPLLEWCAEVGRR